MLDISHLINVILIYLFSFVFLLFLHNMDSSMNTFSRDFKKLLMPAGNCRPIEVKSLLVESRKSIILKLLMWFYLYSIQSFSNGLMNHLEKVLSISYNFESE